MQTFVQTAPTLGNQFDDDRVLQSFLRRRVPADVLGTITPSLARMGGRAVGDLGAASCVSAGGRGMQSASATRKK